MVREQSLSVYAFEQRPSDSWPLRHLHGLLFCSACGGGHADISEEEKETELLVPYKDHANPKAGPHVLDPIVHPRKYPDHKPSSKATESYGRDRQYLLSVLFRNALPAHISHAVTGVHRSSNELSQVFQVMGAISSVDIGCRIPYGEYMLWSHGSPCEDPCPKP